MYKLLIIDDEPIVREGMKCILPWDDLGFSICGECDNGDSALADILGKTPDLAIIDMKMPGKQGIDVIGEARKSGFNGHFIILTGFSSFKYAQSAIRLNVDEYLLKPIDEVELENAVCKVLARLKARSQPAPGEDRLHKALVNLFRGELTSQAELESLGLWKERYRAAALWGIGLSPDDILQRLPSHIPGLYPLILDRVPVILAAGRFAANALLQELEKLPRRKPAIFSAVGREAATSKDVPRSFQESIDLLEKRFFWAGPQVMSREAFRLAHPEDQLLPPDPENYAQEICASVQASNTQRIHTLLEELEQGFDPDALSAEAVRGLLISLYTKLKQKLMAHCPPAKDYMPEEETIVRELCEKTFLYECTEYLFQCFCQVSNSLNGSHGHNVLKKMQTYILRNYAEDLRLEKLADIFGYNSAYLGKLFRAGTGEGFNQYLDRVRIEKAKEYLAQNQLMVYQISEKLGYKNLNYFYMKFKKITGLSPREYVHVVLQRKDASIQEDC